MNELKKLQQENEMLQRKLDAFENDASFRAYYSLNRIVNEWVDFLNGFDFGAAIKSENKDDKTFDRASKIADGLPTKVEQLEKLKALLNITPENEKEPEVAQKVVAPTITSPESMSDVLGDRAGQRR